MLRAFPYKQRSAGSWQLTTWTDWVQHSGGFFLSQHRHRLYLQASCNHFAKRPDAAGRSDSVCCGIGCAEEGLASVSLDLVAELVLSLPKKFPKWIDIGA